MEFIRETRELVKGETIELVCDYCGKKFRRKNFRANETGRYFCSVKCAGTYCVKLMGESHRGKPAYNKGKRIEGCWEDRKCLICGELFHVYKKSKQKFCSNECHFEHIRKAHTNHLKGRPCSEKTRKKLSVIMNSPEVNGRISVALKENNPMQRPEVKAIHAKAMKEKQSPKIKYEIRHDPIYARQVLEAGYLGWLTLTKQLNKYRSQGLPNPSEKELGNILQETYPDEFKYNNGWFNLGGKFPDYPNVNGKKKLIELFGEAYHKPEEVPKRIKFFKKFGWDTLIIWARELQDKEKVKDEIKRFVNA